MRGEPCEIARILANAATGRCLIFDRAQYSDVNEETTVQLQQIVFLRSLARLPASSPRPGNFGSFAFVGKREVIKLKLLVAVPGIGEELFE